MRAAKKEKAACCRAQEVRTNRIRAAAEDNNATAAAASGPTRILVASAEKPRAGFWLLFQLRRGFFFSLLPGPPPSPSLPDPSADTRADRRPGRRAREIWRGEKKTLVQRFDRKSILIRFPCPSYHLRPSPRYHILHQLVNHRAVLHHPPRSAVRKKSMSYIYIYISRRSAFHFFFQDNYIGYN